MGPILSIEGWLVLIIYAPHFKEFEGAYCVCIVPLFRSCFSQGVETFYIFFFFFFISIFMYFLLPIQNNIIQA